MFGLIRSILWTAVLAGILAVGVAWFLYGSTHPCDVLQTRMEMRNTEKMAGASALEKAADSFTRAIAKSAAERHVAEMTPRACLIDLWSDVKAHGI